MAQETRLEVINRLGWRKEFVLDKPIIQIGRDDRNDLVLDDGLESNPGNAVAARHAQLLPSAVNRQGMRLINLSESQILVYAGAGKSIPQGAAPTLAVAPSSVVAPRVSAELGSGDLVKFGDFALIYHGGAAYSEVVKLALELQGRVLGLEQPLSGLLSLHHVGDRAAVQFKIELEGLEPDSYELGPGPVLFPNAEKQIAFQLRHPKRAYPLAGTHRITFHVTAPDAYPGERATISQDIEVAPFYRHKTRVVVIDVPDYQLTT